MGTGSSALTESWMLFHSLSVQSFVLEELQLVSFQKLSKSAECMVKKRGGHTLAWGGFLNLLFCVLSNTLLEVTMLC